jgi:hypothetical protein
MTALGSITQSSVEISTRHLPHWRQGWGSLKEISGLLMVSTLSGSVKVGGVNQVGSCVYLYYRPTGKLIKQTKTDASGNFSFSLLDANDTANYFAVAITDDAGDYNALIFDKLTAG